MPANNEHSQAKFQLPLKSRFEGRFKARASENTYDNNIRVISRTTLDSGNFRGSNEKVVQSRVFDAQEFERMKPDQRRLAHFIDVKFQNFMMLFKLLNGYGRLYKKHILPKAVFLHSKGWVIFIFILCKRGDSIQVICK